MQFSAVPDDTQQADVGMPAIAPAFESHRSAKSLSES
jgi:hypothetical protein